MVHWYRYIYIFINSPKKATNFTMNYGNVIVSTVYTESHRFYIYEQLNLNMLRSSSPRKKSTNARARKSTDPMGRRVETTHYVKLVPIICYIEEI